LCTVVLFLLLAEAVAAGAAALEEAGELLAAGADVAATCSRAVLEMATVAAVPDAATVAVGVSAAFAALLVAAA
jgi:hypothetical protein